jgi:hypothetical protein
MNKIKIFIFILLLISCNHKKELHETNIQKNKERIEVVKKDGSKVSFDMIRISYAEKAVLGNDKEVQNKPHIANLSPYWIGQTEVTQELYEAVMGSNPSQNKNFSSELLNGELEALHPVDSVSWYEAIAFCNSLTKLTEDGVDTEYVYYSNSDFTKWYTIEDAQAKNKKGKLEPKPVFANWEKNGFRLPTESEWEWAALGDAKYKYAGSDSLDEVGWYDCYPKSDKGKRKVHQVRMKKPNGYMLYDMSGNMYEWCWDFYVEGYYTEDGKDFGYDPRGIENGYFRSSRGGCWQLNSRACEITLRNFNRPHSKIDIQGFRLAKGTKS